MKQVMMIIRPNFYFKTKKALSDNRFFAMSTKEVLGRGKANVHFSLGEGENATDEVYENAMVAKKLIEMIVPDEDVDRLIEIVLSVNSHGMDGDGKIIVLPVDESIRIHTGETGEDALI